MEKRNNIIVEMKMKKSKNEKLKGSKGRNSPVWMHGVQ